jgi:hypothetical protein
MMWRLHPHDKRVSRCSPMTDITTIRDVFISIFVSLQQQTAAAKAKTGHIDETSVYSQTLGNSLPLDVKLGESLCG